MTEMLLTLGCIAVCTEADPRDFFFTACTHAGPRIVKLIHCVILYSKYRNVTQNIGYTFPPLLPSPLYKLIT